MRIRDSFLNQEPTFETRMLYAMYTNKYDDNAESAMAYLAAAEELMGDNKSIEELEEYMQQYEKDNSPLTEYDKSYLLAYKDFIKQEKSRGVTNE